MLCVCYSHGLFGRGVNFKGNNFLMDLLFFADRSVSTVGIASFARVHFSTKMSIFKSKSTWLQRQIREIHRKVMWSRSTTSMWKNIRDEQFWETRSKKIKLTEARWFRANQTWMAVYWNQTLKQLTPKSCANPARNSSLHYAWWWIYKACSRHFFVYMLIHPTTNRTFL